MPRPLSPFAARLGAVAAGALVLRVVYVLLLARHVPVAGDSQFFHGESLLISRGHGFIEPFVWAAYRISAPTAAHPPLYPLVLAAASLAGIKSWLGQRLLGCVFGAAAVIGIGLLGRGVGGERVGVGAAVIAALYPTLVAADGALMSESLYGLLIVAVLLLALRLRERGEARAAGVLGVLIGLAALTRSEALMLLVLLVLPLALLARARRLALIASALAGCVLVLAPWVIRNATVFHELTLISHNDSTVLAGANCGATYWGPDLGGWSFDCISPRRTLREGAQAATWRREGLRDAGQHLGRLISVVLPVRVLRTWDLWHPRRLLGYAEGRARWAEEAGTYVYFALLALAVFGVVVLRRANVQAIAVLLVPALLVTISSAIGYGVPRFRQAAEPSIVVLAAYALGALHARRRASRGRPPPPAAA